MSPTVALAAEYHRQSCCGRPSLLIDLKSHTKTNKYLLSINAKLIRKQRAMNEGGGKPIGKMASRYFYTNDKFRQNKIRKQEIKINRKRQSEGF